MHKALALALSLAAGATPAASQAAVSQAEAVSPAAPDLPAAPPTSALLTPRPLRLALGPPPSALAAPGGGAGARYAIRGGWRARGALHQEDDSDEPRYDDDEDGRRHPHLLLSGWGGEALAHGGSGRASSFYGGEVAWAFSELDVGLAGSWYRSLRDATRAWTPVVLTRVTQRFLTQRGFEAAFSLGFGAGRPSGWIGWYQVALGIRFPLGPFFAGGEIAFEQYDIIRLGAGLGVGF